MDDNYSLFDIVQNNKFNTEDYYLSIINKGHKLFWDDKLNAWIVTGYDACRKLIQSNNLSKSRLVLPTNKVDNELIEFVQKISDNQVMFCHGTEAELQRNYWKKQIDLSNENKDEIQNKLSYIAESTINEFLLCRDSDLYNSLLMRYVSRVVCYKLGLSEAERIKLYPMILQYVSFLDGKFNDPVSLKYCLVSIVDLYNNLAKKYDEYPSTRISRHQWISNFILMIVAGHESSAYILATILINIQKDNESGFSLLEQRNDFNSYITESLRFDCPVQIIGRKSISNFLFYEREIKKNDRVFLHIGAANRDPAVFDNPSEFIISRPHHPILSFGLGGGKCIGGSFSLKICETFLIVLRAMKVNFEIDIRNITWDNGVAGRNYKNIPAKLFLEV